MQEFADAIDLLATSDPVVAFEGALRHGRLIGLRTSGTLSAPRLVVRTPESWAASFPTFADLAGIGSTSRAWIPGPLTSTMNLFAAVHARASGAAIVQAASACTHAYLTPASLARALDDRALPQGTVAIVAGDILQPRLRDQAAMEGIVVHHYYGASELSFTAWGTAADDLTAFPGVEVDVRDGVIWSRSPFHARGYATATGPFATDAIGFATVGDLGRLDGGYLRVHGRSAEAITTAGATVLVADIEAELAASALGEIAIVGLPHERMGSLVVAAVTREEDAPRLAAVARDRLAPAARPRRWYAVPELPLTEAGKLDRTRLARMLEAAPALPMAR